ncbi:MAG TPA: T9SS type A sorting domain-containing protein [Candidatus Goldiibacteriota bacterium]|nr:T9SS type A sorting domain-containing protein [Candidatus Goldiibacteriota bacterium]HRQ43729.1 T9SS type A sorting domain-containing protein [Candidatus Goldiibacteriota bacterium]
MKIKHLFLALLFTVLFQSVFGQPYFIYGRLYDAAGNSGNADSENSFASVALFREGILGQVGRQNNGPDAAYPEKIYPAGHSNINTPAYCFTDVGSTDWLDTVNPPQKVRAVFQVMNGVNGWHGGTFVGTSLTDIKPSDMPGSKTELKDTILIKLEAPSIVSSDNNGVSIKWIGLSYQDITGYGIYRYNQTDGIIEKAADVQQSAGMEINYEDTGVIPGKSYRYMISVKFAWGGGSAPADYETFVRSASSEAVYIPEPSPTVTLTATVTGTYTVTETITPTFTITLTPVITATPTITPTSEAENEEILRNNIIKERLIIFTNPVNDNMLKIGFAADCDCAVSAYLYNINGEAAQKFVLAAEKGANVEELILKELSSGLYIIAITLDCGDKKITLPKRKFVIVK